MGNSVTFRLKGCQFENFQKEKAKKQGEKIEPELKKGQVVPELIF